LSKVSGEAAIDGLVPFRRFRTLFPTEVLNIELLDIVIAAAVVEATVLGIA
jgi:hypothetical protein